MKRSFLVSVLALVAGCGAQSSEPTAADQASSYPELYGAGLFSTGAWDFFMAFSPDQRRVLFGRADDAFERYEMFETRLDAGGRWSAPVKPRFATRWSNADPHISPDGRRVFFISSRPNPGETEVRASHDIWMAELGPDGEWGEATRLPAPVNDAALDEWSPAVAASGNLYFGGDRAGTLGGSDLWVSRLVDGVYQEPENLGAAINTSVHELEPWIAPDESYLLFSALRRPDGIGGYDIFLSRRRGDGWEKAVLLGAGVNSRQSDYNHSVTPDGRWLHFSSTRPFTGAIGERFDHPRDPASIRGIGDGKGDMYRIPMRLIGM